jgi:Putative prokaryotic signal transducing protein
MARTGGRLDPGGYDMPMIRLTEPQSMGELAMITSLLEGSGIPYVVQNEHMSSLYPGLPILNSSVMVDERDQVNANMLLSRLRLEVRDVSL